MLVLLRSMVAVSVLIRILSMSLVVIILLIRVCVLVLVSVILLMLLSAVVGTVLVLILGISVIWLTALSTAESSVDLSSGLSSENLSARCFQILSFVFKGSLFSFPSTT